MADDDDIRPQFDPDRFKLRRGSSDDRVTREPAYSAKESFPLEQYEDEDGNIVTEQPEPPRFKSPQELYEARAMMREEAAKEAEEAAEQERKQERLEYGARVVDPHGNAKLEVAFVEKYNAAYQDHEQRAQQFRSSLPDRIKAMQQLASNPATQGQAAELREHLKAESDKLLAERDELTGWAQQAQHYQINRTAQQGKEILYDLAPGLRDQGERARLTQWLRSKHDFPEFVTMQETDPRALARAYRMMTDEDEAARKATEQRKIKATAFAYRGSGSEGTSKEARENLRNTGSTASALRFLQAKRLEKKAGI